MIFTIFFSKILSQIVANAEVTIALFMHLTIVKIRETRKVFKKKRK